MARKALNQLWSLAHDDGMPTEVMEQLLSAHVKILGCMPSEDREAQRTECLDRCVEESKSDKWVLQVLKQIRDICCLYDEAPPGYSDTQNNSQHGSHRHEIIRQLVNQHSLLEIATENLTNYVERMRTLAATTGDIDVSTYCPDGRYNHIQHIEERLNFLCFLLKDGRMWLNASQAHQIWSCLAERAVFPADREVCFKWFSELIGDVPNLNPNIHPELFLKQNIVQLDPALLTESGFKCFDKFFRAVNQKAGKVDVSTGVIRLMKMEKLIVADYIWRVVMNAGDEIANKAIELLLEIHTNLGPQLQMQQKKIHMNFIRRCMNILHKSCDVLQELELECERDVSPARQRVATRLCRLLKMLQEFFVKCDEEYGGGRIFLPLFRGLVTGDSALATHNARVLECRDVDQADPRTIVRLLLDKFSAMTAQGAGAAVPAYSVELKCSVCLDLFITPTTLNCGHTFCAGCVRNVPHCPLCRADIPKPLPSVSVTLNNIVSSVRAGGGKLT